MSSVICLTFNDFQENTYIVVDDQTKECIIFDPGCASTTEKMTLSQTIEENGLKPVRLINTHCHLDHVFGNAYVADTFGLGLEIHQGELPVLKSVPAICKMYGLPEPEPSPEPSNFLKEGETITFGDTQLEILFTPGHSPASLSFYNKADRYLIAGDVLFYGSIGRTDLPGGDYNTLISVIKEQLFPLGDDVQVYPGHGPATKIGFERQNNPFLS